MPEDCTGRNNDDNNSDTIFIHLCKIEMVNGPMILCCRNVVELFVLLFVFGSWLDDTNNDNDDDVVGFGDGANDGIDNRVKM